MNESFLEPRTIHQQKGCLTKKRTSKELSALLRRQAKFHQEDGARLWHEVMALMRDSLPGLNYKKSAADCLLDLKLCINRARKEVCDHENDHQSGQFEIKLWTVLQPFAVLLFFEVMVVHPWSGDLAQLINLFVRQLTTSFNALFRVSFHIVGPRDSFFA